MVELNVRHFNVRINKSFVHLVQYGNSENIIKSAYPQSSVSSGSSSPSKHNASNQFQSNESASSSTTKSPGGRSSSAPSTAANSEINKLVVFIPGNPGLLGVYHDFLVALYKTLSGPSDEPNSGATVILGMSHNNFDHPDYCCDYRSDERICVNDNEMNFIDKSRLNDNFEPHHVELQVINKLFILKHLLKLNLKQPANKGGCKLVFVGHSIGCYIILRLLQDKVVAVAHAGSILVHPALENLVLTERGASLANYFALKLDLLTRAVAYVIEKVIPKSARLNITKWYCSREFVQSSSDIVISSMAQLVCSVTLNALIGMAKSELVSVKDLNHDKMIGPHASKLKLIYTLGDQWVNTGHRLELSQLYPDLYIEEQQTLHAFVMDPKVVVDYVIKIARFIQDYFD